MLILIAQKKGFDALNTTQKTPALCRVPFLKKINKNWLKMVKNGQNGFKIIIMSRFFLIFSEMVLCTELGFFAIGTGKWVVEVLISQVVLSGTLY